MLIPIDQPTDSLPIVTLVVALIISPLETLNIEESRSLELNSKFLTRCLVLLAPQERIPSGSPGLTARGAVGAVRFLNEYVCCDWFPIRVLELQWVTRLGINQLDLDVAGRSGSCRI